MATSGTQSFSLDVADIIEEAYERCGLEAHHGYTAKTARRQLNLLLTDWVNRGIPLWKVNQKTLDLVDGTSSYTLPVAVIDILEAVLRRSSVDTTMERISIEEYLYKPSKSTEGRPSQFAIERNAETALGGTLYVWPTPENSTDDIIYYSFEYPEDVSTSVNTVDVPRRFIPALISGLAYYVARSKPKEVDMERRQELKVDYEEDFERAALEDSERASTHLVPDLRRV